jgi:hypothetical protein
VILDEIRDLAIRGSASPGCACKRIHIQIRSIVERVMQKMSTKSIDDIAEALASSDGKLNKFLLEKDGFVRTGDSDFEGLYDEYTDKAEEMVRRLNSKGYAVQPL